MWPFKQQKSKAYFKRRKQDIHEHGSKATPAITTACKALLTQLEHISTDPAPFGNTRVTFPSYRLKISPQADVVHLRGLPYSDTDTHPVKEIELMFFNLTPNRAFTFYLVYSNYGNLPLKKKHEKGFLLIDDTTKKTLLLKEPNKDLLCAQTQDRLVLTPRLIKELTILLTRLRIQLQDGRFKR